MLTCWPLQPCTIRLLAKNVKHLNIEWYHIPTILRAIHCASSFTLISKHFSIIKQMISLKRKKNPLRMKQKKMTWQKNTFINEYFVLIFSFKSNNFVWDEISVWYYIHRFCLISSLSRYQNLTFICQTYVFLENWKNYELYSMHNFYLQLNVFNDNIKNYSPTIFRNQCWYSD